MIKGWETGAPVEVRLKAFDFVAVKDLGADVGVVIQGAGFFGVGFGGSGDSEGVKGAAASSVFVGELNVFGVVLILVLVGHVGSN